MTNSPSRIDRRLSPEAGMTLVEVLVASAIVAIALLAHAATTLAGHRFGRSEETRGLAIGTLRRFVERMRSDEDWEGLYARLRTRADAAGAGTGAEPTLYVPSAYYDDLSVPPALGEVGVRVDVPAAPPEGGGPRVLREDVADDRFGLPADLNGDGRVDAASRSLDYRALPVQVTFRWTAAGEPSQTLVLATWLRGER
jgi:prepilin-type N-terminal cleavage/methylation domain-containing protein